MIKEKKHHWASKKEKKKTVSKIKKFIRPALVRNILFVLFFGVALYAFIFADFMEVDDIKVTNSGIIAREDIDNFISQEIDGKYFKIISKRNFVFFGVNNLERKLKSNFKKIKLASVKRIFPNKANIEIQERNLILSLCSRGACYFIDERGYAYERMNPNQSPANQSEIIELIDESGKEIRENEYVLLPSYIEFIVAIRDELKNDTNVEILNQYRTRSRISEELIVQTKNGWDIYLNAKIPIEKSIQTLKTLLNRHLLLRDLHELEYIDLRSENKVFYRMKGGVTQEEEELKKESAQNSQGDSSSSEKD
ncbi:MAG: hypothetical protein ACD_7C00310G0010 [uncultured bacterium]|nr:MAG: hypothetical protein ACD_7C00310G0010 [uncultured bacterium]HBR79498.1 hypothetical protein [Candidatus Moranbacteria bacterium]